MLRYHSSILVPFSRLCLFSLADVTKENTEDITRFIAMESRSYVVSVSSLMRKSDFPDDLPNIESNPTIRHLAALVVGASRLPPMVFARFAYLGALVWSGTFIGLGYVVGEEWTHLIPLLHRSFLIGGLLVSLGCIIGIFLIWRKLR